MTNKGYTEDYAQRVFRQLEGFGSYGFPESHAVSFALLVYVSSWIKCYYPDVFACALLNSMPMGFYQPAQIIIDARKHGVEVRPIDVNHSTWDNTLEELSGKYCALRLGFRQIKGLREVDIHVLLRNRKTRYNSIQEIRETGISEAALEKLADADCFRSLDQDRRKALWEVSTIEQPLRLFPGSSAKEIREENIHLPEMTLSEHVVHDYATTSLSIKAHPVRFVRDQLTSLRVKATADLANSKNGDTVKVAGLILVRQRPGTAKGVCFITIEDETGTANLVAFQNIFDKYRKEIIQSRLLMVEGKLQIEGEVIHVIVSRCYNLSRLLHNLVPTPQEDISFPRLRPDETSAPPYDPRDPETKNITHAKIFHKGRNFK